MSVAVVGAAGHRQHHVAMQELAFGSWPDKPDLYDAHWTIRQICCLDIAAARLELLQPKKQVEMDEEQVAAPQPTEGESMAAGSAIRAAIRSVDLIGEQVTNPEPYPMLEGLGFRNLPDFEQVTAIESATRQCCRFPLIMNIRL